MFIKKRNGQGAVVRYKARLVAKDYTQIPGRDYDLTYSLVIDGVTYRYQIAFALIQKLAMHLMDVVIAYLYGILDTKIYMKAPPELLQRIAFHVQGEKAQSLDPDLQSGINQIAPREDFQVHNSPIGPSIHTHPNMLHTRNSPIQNSRSAGIRIRPTTDSRGHNTQKLSAQHKPSVLHTAGPQIAYHHFLYNCGNQQ